MNVNKNCKCNSKTRTACGNCSRLRMVFLMDYELGNIQNPVYYSFQAEDRKYKDGKELAQQMLDRLAKLHRGRYHKIVVFDNRTAGKPQLFEFKKN
ncbi:hypothetical protein KORDIASMS9_00417 [Kordia sp. SMS9]|uniref:hypothetical protein n=1 Tax=Kordia sp. SMS9 TaxID=2282170 RepID=UPI000E10DE00|nr:hypothetical protein [Kordia sp. SMS9]AXG68225.1 hypothetical protein KORDIASMS9_00417 [Kordia sp. SMS9]